jgi:flagellar basal-body rod protein FlgB
MGFDIFGPTYTLLSKVLDFRSQRHTAISSNIANADTPNFKAVRIDFESELRRAMPPPNRLKLKTTDGKHMPYKPDFSKIKPSVYKDSFQVQTPDGNTVDIDKEIVKMSKNQLMYNAVTQIIGKKFKGLSTVIKETK